MAALLEEYMDFCTAWDSSRPEDKTMEKLKRTLQIEELSSGTRTCLQNCLREEEEEKSETK